MKIDQLLFLLINLANLELMKLSTIDNDCELLIFVTYFINRLLHLNSLHSAFSIQFQWNESSEDETDW